MTLIGQLFLETDPILFAAADVNIYKYCGNDPTNNTDADGTSWASAGRSFLEGAATGALTAAAVVATAAVIVAIAPEAAAAITGTLLVAGAIGGASSLVGIASNLLKGDDDAASRHPMRQATC